MCSPSPNSIPRIAIICDRIEPFLVQFSDAFWAMVVGEGGGERGVLKVR